MAREYEFKAILHFSFTDHAEYTSFRTTVQNFAAANGGEVDLITREDEDEEIPYWGKMDLVLPVTGRSDAASKMDIIDAALSTLPTLVATNGKKLQYNFNEWE
jgi:hypothetical protein